MLELNSQNAPFDDDMPEEEAEDELAPGMHVVGEGDDDEAVAATDDEELDEDDEDKDEDGDEEGEEPKDGLAALDEMAEALDEPPLDLGNDD